MLYRQQQTDTSIAAGFLETRRNRKASWLFNLNAGWMTSLYHRIAEHHRRKRLHRQTMHSIAQLNDHMLSDVGWPGRYDPEKPGNQPDR